MSEYLNKLSIKQWADEDRPREKLLLKGKSTLSDAELLAILIGSGSREESAVDLTKRILNDYDNDLNVLGKLSVADLMNFKGIGEAKAITIVAALELGRRRQATDVKERVQVKSSVDAYNALVDVLSDLPYEEFWVLYLNRANKIMGRDRISAGGVAGTVVDAKIIFKNALANNASSIILAHNHPSGNLSPSQADKKLTKNIVEAGTVMDINVFDHLIIGEKSYYSFADEGLI